MGLGSDSEPVPVTVLGQQTYLADSMQFALEYCLRIQEGVPGVYYISTSFRGISVAEQYITKLVSVFLHNHDNLVERTAGTTKHLVAFLEHLRANGNTLPQITVEDALRMSIMDHTCWKYVVPSDHAKGRALTRVGEVRLVEYFGGAVWLTDMDHLSVPFYQAFTDESHTKARCADLLLTNGETLGLGERHKEAKDVHAALQKHEVASEKYSWYTAIREQKAIKTTGWGLGIERFLAWVLAHDDIRNLTLVPRMKGFSFAP